jgi:hypothetical protein
VGPGEAVWAADWDVTCRGFSRKGSGGRGCGLDHRTSRGLVAKETRSRSGGDFSPKMGLAREDDGWGPGRRGGQRGAELANLAASARDVFDGRGCRARRR